MKSNVRIAAGIAIIILGLLVIITPRYLFPVCEENNDDSSSATSMLATIASAATGSSSIAMAQEDGMGAMTTGTSTSTGTMTGMDNMGTTTSAMDTMEDDMAGMEMDEDTDMDAVMDMSSGHADCYYTSRGALLLGLLIMLAGVAIMLATSADAIRLLSLVLGGMGAAVILLPTYLLPICENPQMQCHDGSEPLLIVLGALVILVAAVMAAMAGKNRAGQS